MIQVELRKSVPFLDNHLHLVYIGRPKTILMRYILIGLFATCFHFNGLSQDQNSKTFAYENSVELDLLGPGGFYSINYERIFVNRDKYKFSGQLGFSFVQGATIPLMLNNIISFNTHHIEMGVGHAFVLLGEPLGHELELVAKVGYRFQKPAGRFLFKASFTPMLQYRIQKRLLPWGALTFGYNF